ncbi:MAG: hypothetical protein ACLGPL_00225 [Acidobacteriota bacterium]
MRFDQMKMATKQMVEFNKMAVGSGFNAMVMMQDQTERMVNSLLEQIPWIPEEGKKAMNDWGSACKKGRDELKKAVDMGFEKIETFFVQNDKSE